MWERRLHACSMIPGKHGRYVCHCHYCVCSGTGACCAHSRGYPIRDPSGSLPYLPVDPSGWRIAVMGRHSSTEYLTLWTGTKTMQ
jgi:hypothetical protein